MKAIEAYGGKFLVRGGRSEAFEDQCAHPRSYSNLLTTFSDYEAAKKWYHSAQYEAEAARHVRTGAAELNMMVVEGL